MRKATKLALINALIAGGIAFFSGSLSTGSVTRKEFIISFSVFAIVFLTKCKEYFGRIKNKKAIKGQLLEFI